MNRATGPGADAANHRQGREEGRLIYPVFSRRSGGLSVGVNLFPDRKTCNFDCPYCEVFPFPEAEPCSVARLAAELDDFLEVQWPASWAPEPIKDLCISGNGEPGLSPQFAEAAGLCAAARRDHPALLGGSSLVVITNSTGFLREEDRLALSRAQDLGFELWAKLDGGTEATFSRMSRSRYSLAQILGGIRHYAASRPLTIQTMLCAVDDWAPGEEELRDYAAVLAELLAGGALIPAVQLYTLARPSPEGRCRALPDSLLARWAAELRRLLARAGASAGAAAGGVAGAPRVTAFGARASLSAEGGAP